MTFREWLRMVDAELEERCGLDTGELEANYADMYEDGVSPTEAAEKVMDEWGFNRLFG